MTQEQILQKLIKDMQLRGMSNDTKKSYYAIRNSKPPVKFLLICTL